MKGYHLFLAALMLVTGSINTITTKFADITCAKGIASYNRTYLEVTVVPSAANDAGEMTAEEKKENVKSMKEFLAETVGGGMNATDVEEVTFETGDDADLVFGPEAGALVVKFRLTDQFSAQYVQPSLMPNSSSSASVDWAAAPCSLTVAGKVLVGPCPLTDLQRMPEPNKLLAGGKLEINVEKDSDLNTCENWEPKDHQEHLFDHPFVQAGVMFIGEFLCLVVFYLVSAVSPNSHLVAVNFKDGEEPKTISPLWYAIPALCDCTATSMMYLGLTLTYASSFQMLRGAVIIFTGLMAIVILKRSLKATHWAGMVVVLMGLVLVGGAAFVGGGGGGAHAPNQVVGDIIIIAAQVVVAFQMVVEEKLNDMGQFPALKAVGFEGLFGCIYITGFVILFNHIDGPRAGNHFEDAADAFAQILNSSRIVLALIGTIISIALFNFSGLSVTKEMSATTRMVLDSLRTIVIWVFGLIAYDKHTGEKLHWETFDVHGPGFMQLGGFVFLIAGSMLYNEHELPSGKTEPLLYPVLRKLGCLSPLGAESEPLMPGSIQGYGN